MVPTGLVLLLMVVIMVRLIPGSIVEILLEETGGSGVAEVSRRELEHRLGLDDPLPLTYLKYVGGVARGDLGTSLWEQKPVTSLIWDRTPVTLEIAGIAIVVSILAAIPVGVISAVRQDSWADYLLRSLSIGGISLPSFVVGTAIVIFPALWFGWSVSFRYVTITEDPLKHLTIVIPPAFVLGLRLSATIARMTRTMMLEVMQQDYVRTARAKGLSSTRVIVRHSLPNALIPVVTLLGLQLAFLVGGSVITETIFAIPGIGRLLIDAIRGRDYPVVQGIVVVIGALVMFTNLLVDLSYGFLDPRVRVG